ncbi:MAG: arginine--tRNA ligase [Chitinophagales bacterium]|nr:arginine--tRNA ligase [Bacteroidota bacterium]MCB9042251.1 arginine--tRNA ligase [Chitinophagales bacterium]
MQIENKIRETSTKALQTLFGVATTPEKITLNPTPKEFEGDFSIVVFAFVRDIRRAPEQIAQAIGEYLQENLPELARFNVQKGFLNLYLKDNFWSETLLQRPQKEDFFLSESQLRKIVLEYCGPNTNKPMHLGHLRTMMIGYAMANILAAVGNKVHKVNILNDRGIAICKSMLAWKKTAYGATPQSTGIKGDHFIGIYYVKFDTLLQAEYAKWQHTPTAIKIYHNYMEEGNDKTDKLDKTAFFKQYKNEYFNHHSALGAEARTMLQLWEAGDADTVALWKMMNDWVYEGFNETYAKMGIDFEKEYKESDYYERGKEMVREGLKEGFFYQKPDTSIWVDLNENNLGEKVLLRSDGTSMYVTQDMAVIEARYEDYHMNQSIYVVADEQNYHFQVLQKVLEKMGKPYAEGIFHLAYGMVNLPSGKMKSREGTTVDADDLVNEVIDKTRAAAELAEKSVGLSETESANLYEKLGVGAIKYYILHVNPKKTMLFNPEDSININGHSAVFIQYAHVRTRAILRKYNKPLPTSFDITQLENIERELIISISQFPAVVKEAAQQYDPSLIANYAYHLAKNFNRFFHELPILNNDDAAITDFRVYLSASVGDTLAQALHLLGIEAVDKM